MASAPSLTMTSISLLPGTVMVLGSTAHVQWGSIGMFGDCCSGIGCFSPLICNDLDPASLVHYWSRLLVHCATTLCNMYTCRQWLCDADARFSA